MLLLVFFSFSRLKDFDYFILQPVLTCILTDIIFFWQPQSIILGIKIWKYLFKNWWGKSLGKFKAKITRSCFLACVSHGGKWNRKINHIHERLLQIVCTRRATNGGEHVLPFFENKKKMPWFWKKILQCFQQCWLMSTTMSDIFSIRELN